MTIRRSLLLATALLAAAAAPAVAQTGVARSDTDGFQLGLHLNGSAIAPDGDDVETESGGGLGVRIGYGFSQLFSLFLNVDAAAVEYADLEGEDYTLAQADLGARFSFRPTTAALRPYAEAALLGIATQDEEDGVEVEMSGAGLALGGGVEYFLSPSFALDAELLFGFGEFQDAKLNGDEVDFDGVEFSSTRLNVGFNWHP